MSAIKGSTVHLIDDEPEISGLISELVERIGLACQAYADARGFLQAWPSVAEQDIIVLDLMMPVMDGIELMRGLADLGCKQGIVLISGSDEEILHSAEVLGKARGLRLLKTLAKPVNLSELSRLLLEYVGQADSINRLEAGVAILPDFNLEDVRRALASDQMELHYQPQVRISDGLMVGVEALVRWRHPRFGLVPPDRFVPLMEQHAIIGQLTRQVIAQSVRQQRRWSREFFPLTVSVNISSQDTTSLDLPDQLAQLLALHELDPECLILEITETALMSEPARSLDMLTRLRLKGVRLSIDDFGTGFSSFLQLYRAPFSELKIDRTFVGRMKSDPEAMTIVEICIQLAHKLKMRTVAEGVEDEESLVLLESLGCDIAQGYHIARPMPESKLQGWVESGGFSQRQPGSNQ